MLTYVYFGTNDLERAILQHRDVQDCAVVGIPDDKWGEAVMAAVQLKSEATATADDLKTHCRALLGGLKVPKEIVLLGDLPRSGNGKVLRRAIRDPYWAGRSRSV